MVAPHAPRACDEKIPDDHHLGTWCRCIIIDADLPCCHEREGTGSLGFHHRNKKRTTTKVQTPIVLSSSLYQRFRGGRGVSVP